jgi:hypothetical protein
MSAELRSLLREQARAAIAAGRPDALALFEAYDLVVSAPRPDAPHKEEPPRLVTKEELRALLSIKSDRTIEGLCKGGKIPPEAIVRVGRRVRYDLARVLEALRGERVASQSAGARWAERVGALRVVDGGRR